MRPISGEPKVLTNTHKEKRKIPLTLLDIKTLLTNLVQWDKHYRKWVETYPI